MEPTETPGDERRAAILRALTRYRARLARKLEGLRGDLAEAERSPEHRRRGETLLTYLHQVPRRASKVTLPDPADPAGALEIALDPALKPQENAARYFKRAAKGERGLAEIPGRVAAVEAELHALDRVLEHARRAEEHAPLEDGGSHVSIERDPHLDRDLEALVRKLPPAMRQGLPIGAQPRAAREGGRPARPPVPGRLEPRRLKTTEGWDVLIGRNNEGNDYLTHQLARPEDYWFHVHGAAGSHVVLRRGKGRNEPSKRTIEEVCAWAAFYSQARTAGKVPVIVTLKKYVRKPRKAPPGLALCEREKTVMVRPQEPPRSALADAAEGGSDAG
jgi:predicted ribosome quality control (RQC) complex YloA/Tae2 family protein